MFRTSRLILDECEDVIGIIDREGRIVEMSRSMERLLGYTRDELLGRRVHELVLQEELRRIPIPSDDAAAGQVARYERHFIRKDGSAVLMEVTAQKLSDGHFMAISRDVAKLEQIEYLKARQAKQHEELQNQAHVLENIAEGVNYVDQAGMIRFTNAAFDEMFGYERGELLGKPVTILNALSAEENEHLVADLLTTLAAGGVWVGEFKNRKKDGTTFTTKAKIKKLPLQGEAHWVTVQEDVTAQKRTELALRQLHKMESLGSLAAGIAHDFNNILTVIAGHAEIVDMELPSESPLREDIECVKVACERAMRLTRQLLIFGRKRLAQPTVMDLNFIVQDMSKMLGRLIGEDVQLLISLADKPCTIVADSTEMEQVLMNLVINARDAMPKGGTLRLETRNLVLGADHLATHPGALLGPHIVLTVSDTGMGMNAETRARIFDPFFTTKPRGQGTGLGLATVHGIVAQAGGSIEVDSEPGRGSTFRIFFPQSTAAPSEVQRDRTSVVLERGGDETILVVEDDALVRRYLVGTLRDAGYHVLEAATPTRAIQMALEQPRAIHLLLTDVIMPEMNGLELAERLCQICHDMQVLFVSGYTDDAVLRHGITTNEIAFLRKPFTWAELAQKVRGVLDSGSTFAPLKRQSIA